MRTATTIPAVLLAALLVSSATYAQQAPKIAPERIGSLATANGPNTTLLNINNFRLWVDKKGLFPWTATSAGDHAGEYPPGLPAIFTEGFVWGAKVRDGLDTLVRVGGSTYLTGLKAGKVLYDAGGNVSGSELPMTRHIWRVRADYQTADLNSDAASYYNVGADQVTDAQIQSIYDQYDYDWQHWPAAEGAPFVDVNGDGVYDASSDVPGVKGAQQTVWLVANDLPYTDGTPVSHVFAGAPPIGVEVQTALYAASHPSLEPLHNMLFKHVRFIYTGLPDTPDSAHIDTMYFTLWADPDVGSYRDDFVGFDRQLDMGYAYNGEGVDPVYEAAGLMPPAVGHVLLEGPKENGDALPTSAFFGKGTGGVISDPDLNEYNGSLQWFNFMEGFLPRPAYPEQVPFRDPNGDTTKFTHDGDPITGTGWIDGTFLPPGDRRYWMSMGPFSMALGDTQEVTLALVGGLGGDRLASVSILRQYARWAKVFHEGGLPPLEITPEDVEEDLPTRYALSQNYPNPFNPTTRIDYDVPIQSFLNLAVYNLLGQEVISLVQEQAHPPGTFSVVWDGRSWKGELAPAGVYLYRLEALPPYVLPGQGIVKTGKMVLLR